MRIAVTTLKSISAYSQSRAHFTPKLNKESFSDYEERTWRERLHVGEDGNVFIPPMAFKNCLSEIAKYLGKQIPGKGKSTYTKHFEAGVLVMDPMVLHGVTKDNVAGEQLFVPADGKRGSDKRVLKRFPVIPKWEGVVTFHILDDTITQDVFIDHLQQAGNYIGVGRFRPRRNGYYGRFEIVDVQWS